MKSDSSKLAAFAALRRDLAGKVRTGSELLEERTRRESLEAPVPLGGEGLEALVAGLGRGRLVEVLVPGPSRGGGLFLAALLAQARREGRYAALLDVGGGFAAEDHPARDLESLLWAGCDSVEQAVAAFDVVARDENFHWIVLDGREAAPEDWRRVRAALWRRLARHLRERGAVGVLMARGAVTTAAKDRHELVSRLDLASLHEERARLAATVRVRPAREECGEQGGRQRLVG